MLDKLCEFGDQLTLAGQPRWAQLMASHGFAELPLMITKARS